MLPLENTNDDQEAQEILDQVSLDYFRAEPTDFPLSGARHLVGK